MSAVALHVNAYAKAACDDLCRIAARTAKAQVAVIVEFVDKKSAIIRGMVGSNAGWLSGNATIPGLRHDERPLLVCDDLAHAVWFKDHPLRTILPYATSLIAVSINTTQSRTTAALVVLNPHISTIRDAAAAAALSELSRIASFLLSGDYTAHVAAWADARLPEARNCGDSAGFQESRASDDTKPQVSQDPIATFLLKTLVPRRSLRSRRTAHYVALRSWKQSVKDTQIAALRSLKAQLQPTAVALIAEEIATAARELYGGMTFTCVVPVPCGSSGHPRCLSVLLAEHVAMLLGVPFRQVLTGAVSRGASHPRKNSALPQFQVHGEISGQVLVIDDVASTGTHIELAVRALRAKGASPLAIAWIGS